MRYKLLTVLALAVACCGCTSARSILLHRGEHNLAWQRERHLPGIPITLKVPTHLKITVVEKHYIALGKTASGSPYERVALPIPVRQVQHEFILTDKIFTVDFKRPAAGEFDLDVQFRDDEQYFKQIKHHVVDETIEDVALLVSKLAPQGVFAPATDDGSQTAGVTLKEIESVVAVKIFEIEAPDFEAQLSAFLDCHINQSHDAWVVPPGVDAIRRLPLTVNPYDQTGPPLCPDPNCQPGVGEIPLRLPQVSLTPHAIPHYPQHPPQLQQEFIAPPGQF